MIAKSLLVWLSLISPCSTEIKDNDIVSKTQENVHTTLSQRFYMDEKNTISSDDFLEILNWDLKQEIINWTLAYFEKDVTFSLTPEEKEQLKWELKVYLSKYPNIVYMNWNNVLLNLNETNFMELFKILLP